MTSSITNAIPPMQPTTKPAMAGGVMPPDGGGVAATVSGDAVFVPSAIMPFNWMVSVTVAGKNNSLGSTAEDASDSFEDSTANNVSTTRTRDTVKEPLTCCLRSHERWYLC